MDNRTIKNAILTILGDKVGFEIISNIDGDKIENNNDNICVITKEGSDIKPLYVFVDSYVRGNIIEFIEIKESGKRVTRGNFRLNIDRHMDKLLDLIKGTDRYVLYVNKFNDGRNPANVTNVAILESVPSDVRSIEDMNEYITNEYANDSDGYDFDTKAMLNMIFDSSITYNILERFEISSFDSGQSHVLQLIDKKDENHIANILYEYETVTLCEAIIINLIVSNGDTKMLVKDFIVFDDRESYDYQLEEKINKMKKCFNGTIEEYCLDLHVCGRLSGTKISDFDDASYIGVFASEGFDDEYVKLIE